MEQFANRRTIRKYQNKEISDSLLSSIVKDAMRAPTCGNMQLYSVIVTRTQAGKELLAPLHFNQPMVKESSVVLTVCADFNRFTRWCELSSATPGYDNFLSFITALQDATIFAQQICTIAEHHGLGTCWLGTVLYNGEEISKVLDLPELCVPVACITMGYPDEDGVATERLPMDAIMHQEKYRHDSDIDIINYHKTKDEYPANKIYLKESGKETLAQVFTEIRYTKEMNEAVSDKLSKFLKKKGF